MLASPTEEITIRRELHGGDALAMVDLHRRVYCPEYGRNERFVRAVAESLAGKIAQGWPATGGAVWLLERGGRLVGSLGLTVEGPGLGQVRWVVFEEALRGLGLGRSLVQELVATARAVGMHTLQLQTFSDLRTAAHLYREVGFRVVWERQRDDWGESMTYQGYEASLR
ncbi:MAG TPA: GNAT family N-acetyltransferase [Myxococcaceae bacterium]